MSMWEIEALIEQSIRLVAASKKQHKVKRNLIWNLYEVQNNFDTMFTNFRVIDILLKYNFTYALPLEEHPNYQGNESFFDELKDDDFSYINVEIDKSSNKTNPITAYWHKKTNSIYYDFGSPLWEQLHQEEGPTQLPPYELDLTLLIEADRQEDKTTIYDWMAFMLQYGAAYIPPTGSVDNLVEHYFKEMSNIYKKYDFSTYEPMHKALVIPTEETTWYRPQENALIRLLNS